MKLSGNDDFKRILNYLRNIDVSVDEIVIAMQGAEEMREGLLARSPAQPGDVVVLIETPVINDHVAPGWLGSKHFLVKGAKAKVYSVEFFKGKFHFYLKFEKDSWIYEGKETFREDKEKPVFWFSEDYIVKI